MKNWTIAKTLPWLLVIFGTIGALASFIITAEKVTLLEEPSTTFVCDLNPIISCGSVMSSDQASVFGFPNSFLGMVTFPVLITLGVLLLTKVTFKRWIWLGMQIGMVFGVGMSMWLFFQSTYRIGALCPYCITVWISSITVFWYTLLYNLEQGHIKPPRQLIGVTDWMRKHHLDIIILWFAVITGLILNHFWYYFGPALGF